MAIHNNLRVINSRLKEHDEHDEHDEHEENDFYATEPRTVYELLEGKTIIK